MGSIHIKLLNRDNFPDSRQQESVKNNIERSSTARKYHLDCTIVKVWGRLIKVTFLQQYN